MPHHSGISSCFLYKILAFEIHSSPRDFSNKPPWGGYRNRLEPSLNYWVIMVAVLHEFGLIVPGSYITYLSAQILHLHAWVILPRNCCKSNPWKLGHPRWQAAVTGICSKPLWVYNLLLNQVLAIHFLVQSYAQIKAVWIWSATCCGENNSVS